MREDGAVEKRLVAYITRAGEGQPGVEELRAHLAALLPEYMVPCAFVMLESLPLTPNGDAPRANGTSAARSRRRRVRGR